MHIVKIDVIVLTAYRNKVVLLVNDIIDKCMIISNSKLLFASRFLFYCNERFDNYTTAEVCLNIVIILYAL